MEIKQVDPYDVNVDEMNERKENLNLSDLEASVAKQGVIQPPIVRKRNGDAEVPYSVVVGQRRVLAAQGAGAESIPVVVMDFDDADALEASITENIDVFQESVSKKDRAVAIERLMELKGWGKQDVAESLGVSIHAVRRWLEFTRPEWEGTSIHPETSTSQQGIDVEEQSDGLEEVSTDIIQQARSATGGGKEGEQLLKEASEKGLNKDDMREVSKKTKRGQDVDEAVEDVVSEKKEQTGPKVKVNVTFFGETAEALTACGKDRGISENDVGRKAVTDYLEREGYL